MKRVKGQIRRYERHLEGWIPTGNERGDYLAGEGSGGTAKWHAKKRERDAFGQAGTKCVFDHPLIGLRSVVARVNGTKYICSVVHVKYLSGGL